MYLSRSEYCPSLRRIVFDEDGNAVGRIHVSSESAPVGLSAAALGTWTVPLRPSKPAAVFASFAMAPGRPSVTPPT